MSNRRITIVAAVIVYVAAFYSQAIPANGDGVRSILSRQSNSPNQDDLHMLADDDSDSSELLCCNINGSFSHATILSCVGRETIILPSNHSTGTTLASQHILLRL